jgi:hypothetical protein
VLPPCGRTHAPHAVRNRRGLFKLRRDRLELGRSHAGLLLGLIQLRVSGVFVVVVWLGPLAPTRVFRPWAGFLTTGYGAEGSPFFSLSDFVGPSEQDFRVAPCVVCRRVRPRRPGRSFCFLFFFWRGPAGDHQSTGLKHPGYTFRQSGGSLPPSWQSAGFRPRQQSGENLFFRVAPVSSVFQAILKDSGASRPLVCTLCQCFSLVGRARPLPLGHDVMFVCRQGKGTATTASTGLAGPG